MPLLNYTTAVDVEKTVGEIRAMLDRFGARRIVVVYTDGLPDSLTLEAPTPMGPRPFALPARIEPVLKTLVRQHEARKVERRHTTREHAARVAWRILRGWVEHQLAIIESGMVTLDEVFLPYMLDGRGVSMYETVVAAALPAPGKPTKG